MASLAGNHKLIARREKDRPQHDWLLLAASILLVLTGFLSLASIDKSTGTSHLTRQLLNFGLGLGVFFFFNRIKLESWRKLANPLYIVNVALLTMVLFVGKSRGITSRWIDLGPIQFQPSELSKIFLALTLAAYFANRADNLKDPKTILGAALHTLPIVALVFLQPHNGAALALLCLGLAAAIYAGIPWKHFAVSIAVIVPMILAVWFTPGVLSDYARKRITSVFSETTDIRGSGYQQWMGTLAIASGGSSGTGFANGEQKAAGAVPEQYTDFIFTVIGEEGGFIGSAIVLALFGFFFFRVFLVTFRASTVMSRVVAGSLFTILAFHTVVNLTMVLKLGPVVGLWLPFISYGGTALWMCMAAVALLDQVE